jgi:hypothetical protein
VIDDLPPGDYFLYAVLDTRVIFVDWIVPVHVSPAANAKVDLFNENAAKIDNFE